MLKTPVIIDCDPGHDDAIALLLALANDNFDIKGITTCAGNTYVDRTTKNALQIVELFGREDIPVVSGLETPFLQTLSVGLEIHGESGMEGPVLKDPVTQAKDIHVVDFIANTLEEEADKSVVLITMGPLTNIGLFIKTYPDLVQKIKYISIMGGGIEEGNRLPNAEFNIYNDPEAAQIVLEAGVEILLFPLDVTHKAMILKDEIQQFSGKGIASEFVYELLVFFAKGYVEARKMPGCPMHDPCAVLGVSHPEIFTFEEAYAVMDLDSIQMRGTMVCDFRNARRRLGEPNIKVATDVNRDVLCGLILDACHALDEKMGGRQI